MYEGSDIDARLFLTAPLQRTPVQINLITTVAVTKIQAILRARKTNTSELPLKKLTQQWRNEFLTAIEASKGAGGEKSGRP